MHEDRWVSDRISSLEPSENWQPDFAKGLSRLREDAARATRKRNSVLMATAIAATCLCAMSLPSMRTTAHRVCNLFIFNNAIEQRTASALPKPMVQAIAVTANDQATRQKVAASTNGTKRSIGAHSDSQALVVGIENITSDILTSAADTRPAQEIGLSLLWDLTDKQQPQNHEDVGDDLAPTPLDVAPPPYDPIEPVTTEPIVVRNSDARCAVIEFLTAALRNRAFYEPTLLPPSAYLVSVPYTVSASFTASGSARDNGTGEMEETRNAAGSRRWSGSVGGFSITRIMLNRFYDSGSRGPIPMRLQMVRELVLGNLGGVPPEDTTDSIRTANAELDGTLLNCVLISTRVDLAPVRDWSEREYCVDSQSKMLRVYSAVPGIYVVFDYSDSPNFHGHVVPNEFTVTESGKVVLRGTIHVQDPDATSLDPAMFTPTGQMATGGLGLIWPVRHTQASVGTNGSRLLQPIIVHATLSPDGSVVEAEALQTLDPKLSQSAVDLVKKTKYDSTVNYGHPTQQEIFITVE